MQLPLIALSFAAAILMVSAYPITGDVVNCRSGPGTNHEVVTQYKKGFDVKVTCQIAGENIKGDSLWDKTSDGCYVADYYVKTGTSDFVTAKCSGGSGDGNDNSGGNDSGGNLPGLSDTQSKHARAIIGEAKKENLGRQGCKAGIATALVEVQLHHPSY
jgi:hypothetical protein